MLPDVCELQFSGWKNERFSLKLDKANNCVKLFSSVYVLVENITTIVVRITQQYASLGGSLKS